MAKAATKPAKPPVSKDKFEKVFFLPTEHRDDPSKISQKFMLAKEGGPPEPRTKLRLFDTAETQKTGFNNGLWGENVAETREEIAAWAMTGIAEDTAAAEERLAKLKEADEKWSAFMEKL